MSRTTASSGIPASAALISFAVPSMNPGCSAMVSTAVSKPNYIPDEKLAPFSTSMNLPTA
jgi:hypothetical protein